MEEVGQYVCHIFSMILIIPLSFLFYPRGSFCSPGEVVRKKASQEGHSQEVHQKTHCCDSKNRVEGEIERAGERGG